MARRVVRLSAAVVALCAPPAAALIVTSAAAITPGYDSMSRTVSRLAVPGMPAAAAVDVAIGMTAMACLALALALDGHARTARAALVAAGLGFAVASLIHLDPLSAGATATHRGGSGLAVSGLIAAALVLRRRYGVMSLVLGAAEVAVVIAGLALLATSFEAWGAWERVLLVIALLWTVLVAARIVWSEYTASAARAMSSRSASYVPVSRVNSANR